MSKYTSKAVTVNRPIDEVFSMVSDIKGFQEKLDSLPEEARAKMGDVVFTDDTITIQAQPVGEITFKVVEKKAPDLLVLESAQSPVPLQLSLHLSPESPTSTEVKSEIDVEIPAFLRPLVGGKLQQAADQFGNLIKAFVG